MPCEALTRTTRLEAQSTLPLLSATYSVTGSLLCFTQVSMKATRTREETKVLRLVPNGPLPKVQGFQVKLVDLKLTMVRTRICSMSRVQQVVIGNDFVFETLVT